MAIELGREQKVTIIDKTLIEIYRTDSKTTRLDLISLSWMLNSFGVDLIEINREIFRKIGKPPNGLAFLFRINSLEDAELCINHSLNNCAISQELLAKNEILEKLSGYKSNLMVDFNVNRITDIYRLVKSRLLKHAHCITGIRLVGMGAFVSTEWLKGVQFLKNKTGLNIGICPENNCFNASAIALEAVMNGMDCITTTFAGYGKQKGYAALEELILSVKLLVNPKIKENLNTLPELARVFMHISGVEIPVSKPVLGSGIFNYESGIHADGIRKNPYTYEPYDPSEVGLQRKMAIGKHSGKKSISQKLSELGLQYESGEMDELLYRVRIKSTELKRGLLDSEIQELYTSFKGDCNNNAFSY